MLRKWQKKPCACGTRDSTKRKVVATRWRIFDESCHPRWSAMHNAVKPKPVAAMLATFRESDPVAWLRSFTSPVAGLASPQKNSKQERSRSSKKRSSSAVNLYRVGSTPLKSAARLSEGEGGPCGASAFASCQASPAYTSGSPATFREAPAAPREASSSQSRRESFPALTRGSSQTHTSAPQRAPAGFSAA